MSSRLSRGISLGTAWESGNLKGKGGAHRLIFGQMHEDPEVEREAFAGMGRVFCIASGGNTAMHLAKEHEVVACDLNPVQLQYAQARANGAMPRRGDAERAMEMARQLAPLVGWRRGLVEQFLAMTDVEEQATFWRVHLETTLFKACFSLLLSHAAMRLIYAKEFLKCLPPHFGEVMRARLARGFATHPNATNPYARSLLRGEMMDLPRVPNARIRFVLGDAASYLESRAAGSLDGFALSNILDGADRLYARRLAQAVRNAASENAKVVIRSFREPGPDLKTNLAHRDRSLLWGVVDVRPAKEFTGECGAGEAMGAGLARAASEALP
jgi:S-adenosylmethionine:diacylglycerol 3-amino-3-carboxypropyl transferase